ncbi:MAG: insulinase family protein, partial [Bdellovibrionales bacterium]|nr:insulinase family protein [Bdellovibrionales bacterium]
MFAGVVAVRVGGADEVVGHTGISHMLEHMAFKGTPDLGTKDYAKEKKLLAELERVALQVDWAKGLTKDQARQWKAIIGQLDDLWVNEGWVREYKIRGAQGLNATTSKDLTNYMLELPKSAFEFWCWMESERVIRPVMRQFYRERDVVMEERRMRFDSSPEGKLYEMLLSTAYSAHSYRYPVIGYEFDIRDLTATATAAFQKAYYVPENIVVALVGDVDKERDASIIEKYFGRIPIGTRPAYPHAVEPTQEGLREVVYKVDASRLTLLAYRKPNYPHPDDAKIGIMSEVLAGSRLSPLYKELVEKRRLASDVGAYEGPGNQYPNLLMFQMTPLAPHDNSDVISAFHEILEKFKSNPPSVEELANAKRRVAMSYLGALEENMSIAFDLASSQLL